MKKSIFVLFLIIAFMSCEEPEQEQEIDYRDQYTGEFQFTTLHNVIAMCYDEPDCINGWRVIQRDTVQYWSNISKESTERIKMHLWDSTNMILGKGYHTIIPIINESGLLTLPEFGASYGESYFEGFYIGKDTININFKIRSGMGGYSKYEITGVRMGGG